MTKPRHILSIGAALLGAALMISAWMLTDRLLTQEPTSPDSDDIRQLIVETAADELEYWDDGDLHECDARATDRLRHYWDVALTEVAPNCSAVPWSAVFVSYVQRTAGASYRFGYSSQHSRYIGDAILDRYQQNESLYRAFAPSEVSPQPGDMVCAGRDQPTTTRSSGAHASLDYDKMAELARMAGRGRTSFYSHCDVVTLVANDFVEVVGGNVQDSVRKTTLPLIDGHLTGQGDNDRHTAVVLVLDTSSS